MSRQKNDSSGGRNRQSLDLYEAGDQLFSVPELQMVRQTWPHSASTLRDVRLKVIRSGWMKPTIQLAMLLGLERQDCLSIGGRRRLHKMLASQPTLVHFAAFRRWTIALDPSFESLAIWVNRPIHLRSFNRKAKRRIGVGYRDKGATLRSHERFRNQSPEGILYLGERKELIWTYPPEVSLLVQDYGYLFNHLGDGWWEPDYRLKALMVVRRLLTK